MGPASSSKYPNDILATREGCEINYFDKTPEVVVSKAVLKKFIRMRMARCAAGGRGEVASRIARRVAVGIS
jgi:hypothetical protein